MQNNQETYIQGTQYIQQGEVRYEYQEERITEEQRFTSHQQYSQQIGGGQQKISGGSQQFSQQVEYQQHQQVQLSGEIVVTVHSASELVSVQSVGKQDPYLQFTTDFSDAKSFQKTSVHKSGGSSANWNQSFTIPYGRELFVEVLDQGSVSKSDLIGFAAITLQYAVNAIYTIYTIDGKSAGEIHLSVVQQGQSAPSGNPTRGQSYVHDGHLQRCKSLHKKAIAADVGLVAAGGLLAAGAGLLGKKLYDNHQEKEKQEQEEQAELERLKEENQKLQEEKDSLHEEGSHAKKKEDCEPKKSECEPKKKNECEPKKKSECEPKKKSECEPKKKNECEPKKKSECEPKKKNECEPKKKNECEPSSGHAKEWDPVGTYKAGDRVKYKGATYICLQGHTSNPTWMPGIAHSLWQKA